MSKTGPEAEIERKVIAYAEQQHHMWVRKFKAPGRRNVPDRICMTSYGLVFFVEFKRPGEDLTPGQAREAQRIQERGGHFFVVDSLAQGLQTIELLSDYERYQATLDAASEQATRLSAPSGGAPPH